ncbi:MAG: SpoIIE family protein phosphatase [bacterium]|nr:SpoIIE family protein phosphatase [bacterium]
MNILIKKYNIGLVFLLSLVLLGSCANKTKQETAPMAVEGYIDLEEWDFINNGPIDLDGEWEFYWNRQYEPGTITSEEPSFIKTPASWIDTTVEGKKLSRDGYATYRLHFSVKNPGTLALYIHSIATASRVWINGKSVLKLGHVGKSHTDEKPRDIPEIVEFHTEDMDNEVLIQVSNYRSYHSGIVRSITLGTPEQLHKIRDQGLIFDVFLFGSLIVIGFYHFALFLFRRNERASLWFALSCVLFSFRAVFNNERIFAQIFNFMSWELFMTFNFLTISLIAPLFVKFVYSLYPGQMSKKLNYFFYSFGILYSTIILTTSMRIFTGFLYYYLLVVLMAASYVIAVFIRSVFQKREGAAISLAGFAILFLTAINDTLVAGDYIQSIYLSSFGLFFFFLAQALNLSLRFSRAFSETEKFSELLEEKVLLRTKELNSERDRLKERTVAIEIEMDLAKRIQQKLIPASAPADYIHSLNKPMDLLGGDFYDFLRFRDSKTIGIFISDVSGHGVPASFITSMVKTSLLQAGALKDDPAMLLGYLNEILMEQTAGNFVTAFYGVYYPETKKIRYANAGHNQPYLIAESGITAFDGKKGLPLAIMKTEEMEEMGKGFVNNEFNLNGMKKILFYTDGLVEATHSNDTGITFEDAGVEDVLFKLRDRSCNEFIDDLYTELVNFRGSPNFEDDVCMICLNLFPQ